MSCYYNEYRDMLVLKCDSCGEKVDLYKGETDRLLKHDYIKEHGWLSTKMFNKWLDLCPDCRSALRDRNRSIFLKEDGHEDNA